MQISTISTSIGGDSHCHFPHLATPMICLIRVMSSTGSSDPIARIWLRGDQRIRVGRQNGIDLWVSDPHMSRNHFVVEGFEAGFRLRDLDSRNGTRLNGVRVTVATLQSGDSIQAGATTLGVEFCIDRYDTIGPEPILGIQDNSVRPSRTPTASPAEEPHQSVGQDRHDRGAERSKASDDETQWVVDSTIANATTEMNPVVAAMGVDHVSPMALAFDETSQAANGPQLPLAIRDSSGDTAVPEGLEDFGLHCLPDIGTGCGFALRQAGSRGIDLCEQLGQFYRLLLVVNRSQLDPTCASLLDYLVEQGTASAVTQTVYRIDGDHSRVPLLQLMRRASRRDAAVCLGFRYSDSDPRATINDMSHLLCYPSLLFRQLTRREADQPSVDSLFKKVVFFVFEKDLTGDLYLFTERGFRPAGTLAK